MIYVDTSVVLAHLLSETRRPADAFWDGDLVTSRLTTYESWTRIHALRLGRSHGDALREILGRLDLLELTPEVLARAGEPFPAPVRTLDALHLASAEFLRGCGQTVTIATYDVRMAAAGRTLGIPCVEP